MFRDIAIMKMVTVCLEVFFFPDVVGGGGDTSRAFRVLVKLTKYFQNIVFIVLPEYLRVQNSRLSVVIT